MPPIELIVSLGSIIVALIAVWQVIKERGKNKEDRIRWETEADRKLEGISDDWSIKMDSIDVNWKPQVNIRIGNLEDRMGRLEAQLLENINSVVSELKQTNKLLNEMNTHLALHAEKITRLETDISRHMDMSH